MTVLFALFPVVVEYQSYRQCPVALRLLAPPRAISSVGRAADP